MSNIYRKMLLLFFIIFIVSPDLSSSQSAPSFTTVPPDETTVQLGEQLKLECQAQGSPQPKIVNWLNNDKPVDLQRNYLTLNGDLIIQRTKKEDSGNYQCVAASNIGGIVSTKKKVHVAYFERVATKPAEQYISKKVKEYYIMKVPNYDCHPKPKMTWLKKDKPVVENERLTITKDGDLYLTNLESGDDGRYVLKLENTYLKSRNVDFSEQEVLIVRLTVRQEYVAPKQSVIVYSSPKQIIGEKTDKRAVLECIYSGEPVKNSRVVWKKYDRENIKEPTIIRKSSKYQIVHNDRRLIITNPTFKEDSGKFQCNVLYYEDTRASIDIELEVQSVPEFLVRPVSAVAYTDNSTIINCSSTASPTHKRRWYRNGLPLKGSELEGEFINKNLEISKLNWEDNGIFQCAAENVAGLYFAQMELKVQNKSAEIISELKNLYVGNGYRVEIPCVAIGAPKPVVYWQVNYTRIPSENAKYIVMDNGTLIIKNVTYKDGGQYKCTASNGKIDERAFLITVVVPTQLIEGPEKETRVRKGGNAVLPCNVSHDKNIPIKREWRQNNLPLADTRYKNQTDGSLVIEFAQTPDTYYVFSCHVFSKAGNITVSTSLVIVQLPLYPSSPRPSDIEAYSIRLTWDAPSDGGSPLIGYHLFMRNESMSDYRMVLKLPADSTSVVMKNLAAGSRFKFKVAAENKFGLGQVSAETKWLATKTLAPSAAPSGFTSVASEKDSVTLQWTIPPANTHNGPIKGFIIAHRLPGSQSFINRKVEGGTRTTYVMDGLPQSTTFEVRIAMYNDGGNSDWSRIIRIETKQGIPSARPTNLSVTVLNDTAVRVSFTSPPQQFWNGNLKYILARTWPPGRYKDFTQYQVDYDSSSLIHQTFVLPNLKPDTDYSLAVAVATSGGPSDTSNEVQFKTGEGVPDAVRSLVVADIYADAFSLRWQPPSQPAGVIRGYKVRYRPYVTRLIDDWIEFEEKANVKGAVINNLQSKTKYEVGVAAFTSKGAGTYVSQSVTTIESPVLPSAPTDLKVYAVWGNNISLGWTPGDSGRAVIINFLIEYNNDTEYHLKKPEDVVWRVIRNLTKILENPANITNLKPSTTYRFRIKAFNRVGESPYSNVSSDILTSEGVPSKPPTQIKVTSPDIRRLLIRWVPPPKNTWNAGSVKYQFLVKPKGQNDLLIKTPYIDLPDTLATSYTVTGLQKYTEYNITMRLHTDAGKGPWSKPVFARTSEDYPAGAPTIISGRALDAVSVRLEWGSVPESQRNGQILGYNVYYMILGLPETELFRRFPGNETFSGTITNLVGFTDYEFRMMAYTKVGGLFKGTPKVVKTLEGVPGIPQDIRFSEVNSGYVNVNWKRPTQSNGMITGYQVRYNKNDTEDDWFIYEDQIDPDLRIATIRGLTFNLYYVFEIRARTGAGWGPYAREYVLITGERDVPKSPLLYYIPKTAIRSKSIVVEWTPRFDWNSPIRAYNLQVNEASKGWETYRYGIPPVENIPAGVTKVEVLRLTPSTKYQFRVRAMNDVGPSQWSDESKLRQTKSEAPRGAPSNVRVIKKTASSLFIAWEAPLYMGVGGDLRGYTISYKLIGGIRDVPTEVSIPKSKTSWQLSNLRAFSPYEVRIAAVTENNEPIATQPFEWRTGEQVPLDAPGNIQVTVLSGRKIRVTWTGPTDESVRGFKLGYKIETIRLGPVSQKRKRRSLRKSYTALHKYSKVLRKKRSVSRQRRALTSICPALRVFQTHLFPADADEAIVTNLPKYNNYRLTVRVFNSFADGPKSQEKSFATPIDVPGPPYLLSYRVYTDSIVVDFDPPCNRNGFITGYKVEYRSASTTSLIAIERDRYHRRISIPNLNSLTDYVIYLSAKNNAGYGKKVEIAATTKGIPTPPSAPGAPQKYDTKDGALRLSWDERDNGFKPVLKFYLQYKIGNSNSWRDLSTIESNEVRYDGSLVVYSVVGLKNNEVYRFRVMSETEMGKSPYSKSSKAIRAAIEEASSTPIYKEIWFIFVMIIIVLIIIIIILICCYRRRSKQAKYKNVHHQQYNMSSFERAMVTSDTSRDKNSKNGSIAPSVASQKKPLIKSEMRRSSSNTNSIAKSINPSDKEPDLSDETDIEARYSRGRHQPRDNDSIANHYSNDPFHKNWQDSMDKKTKKALLNEYKKRAPSQASVDTLGEKKRADSEEMLDRPRTRPGRRDMTERKKLTRSEPFLAENDNPAFTNSPRYQAPPVRRPGKKPIEQELTRSVPDINRVARNDNQVNRQPSFLRATTQHPRDSDSESLNGVLEREKTKRELAMELENRVDDYYPHAPPPYDYNGAPPAYTPSQQDDMSDGGHSSNFDYPPPTRPKPYYNPPPRVSDNSDSSRQSSNRYPPNYLDQPDRGGPVTGYYNPQKEYNATPNVKYNPRPSKAQNNNKNYPSRDTDRSSNDGFAPPQNSRFDDEYYDDDLDGDMTLV